MSQDLRLDKNFCTLVRLGLWEQAAIYGGEPSVRFERTGPPILSTVVDWDDPEASDSYEHYKNPWFWLR